MSFHSSEYVANKGHVFARLHPRQPQRHHTALENNEKLIYGNTQGKKKKEEQMCEIKEN